MTAAAIAYAKAQIGKPYCWGGQGPDCFDGSGLVFSAYAAAGVRIARTTYQWRRDGPQVPLSQIQPGDLLFSAGSDGTIFSWGQLRPRRHVPGPRPGHPGAQTGEDVQTGPVDLAGVVAATSPAGLAGQP